MADSKKRPGIIAIELRKAREAKGFTHTDLHRLTGISRSVLSGYEAGRTVPGGDELRLLSEALEVNPNRLLFGNDEPFKPRTGLRAIAKLRNSPAGIVAALLFVPIIFASLDDEQIESILTLLSSLIEARDKEAAKKISVFAEIMGEEIGDGSPEAMAALSKKSNDPDYMAKLNEKIEERLSSLS